MKTWQKVAIPLAVVISVIAVLGILKFRDLTDDSDNPSVATLASVLEVPATAQTAVPDSTAVSVTADVTRAADVGAEADGTYAIDSPPSFVGYRVVEVLFGVDTEGVGRTDQVTGEMTVAGTQVTAASFEVDMATVTSDEERRDNQFRGTLLDTSNFPTATFVLTEPIEFTEVPAPNIPLTATATGDLTLRDVTRPVTFDVQAQRTDAGIQVVGSTDIVFADYGIPKPSVPGITTQDHGLLEFDLRFVPA